MKKTIEKKVEVEVRAEAEVMIKVEIININQEKINKIIKILVLGEIIKIIRKNIDIIIFQNKVEYTFFIYFFFLNFYYFILI